ncbi:hypothetical protein [Streptomyces sp. G45]|uniref:hypothetical protein n=1 Tax=Streptomyces sp. G45 TaxID=3406627 RepID=UPI003C1E9166
MRHSTGLRRVLAVHPSCAASMTAHAPAVAAPPGVAERREQPRIAFAKRYHAVRHGGVVRAADTTITCRRALSRTAVARPGARRTAGPRAGAVLAAVDVRR